MLSSTLSLVRPGHVRDHDTPPYLQSVNGSLAKKKKNKKSDLGMQSVKYGLDKNPNITAADPKAKFIAANKKTTSAIYFFILVFHLIKPLSENSHYTSHRNKCIRVYFF